MIRKPSLAGFVWVVMLIFPVYAQVVDTPAHDNKQKDMFAEARGKQKKLQWKEANDSFEKVIAADPDSAFANKARIELGKFHKYHRDWDKALKYYRDVVSRSPHSREAHDALTAEAAVYYFRQDLQRALTLFQDVLSDTGDWDQIKYCSYWIKEVMRKMSFGEGNVFSCGKESLKIALEMLGVADDESGSLWGDTGAQLSFLDLRQAASKKGLESRVVQVDTGELQNLDTPFIALVRPGHYVVVTAAGNGEVKYVDPEHAEVERKDTLEGFSRDFKGYAMIFTKSTELAQLNFPSIPDTQAKELKGGVCLCCPPSALGDAPNVVHDGDKCVVPGMPYWWVNTVNLNVVVQDIDFSYSVKGMPVLFVRTYNGDDPTDGVFGRSWTFNYNVAVTENPDESIDVRRGDGRVDHFFWNGNRYQGPDGIFDSFVKNQDGTYTLTLKGSKTRQNFNAQGKLTSIVDKNGNAIAMTYDGNGTLTTITDPLNRNITLSYQNGKVSQVTLPDSRSAQFYYDENGNLAQVVDAAGATSSYTYAPTSYMTSITTPHRGTHTMAYRYAAGYGYSISSITDNLGNVRAYEALVTGGTPLSHQATKITDARGYATVYNNTYEGYTKNITTPSGNFIDYQYDESGSINKTTDVFGRQTNITNDGNGNPTLIVDPVENTVTLAYDATNDTLISLTDARNYTYNFSYDNLTNLISSRVPDGNLTNFTYNAFGEVTNLTDANNGRTDFVYDAGGNLTCMRDPLGKTTNYTYDSSLHVASVTDAKGQRFNYTYDGVDHLVNVTLSNGTRMNYSYSCCNLQSAEDGSGMLNFTYNSVGQLAQFTNQDNKIILYDYDKVGNLVNLTYPGNRTVSYEYNEDNQLVRVTDWLGQSTYYNYDRGGRLVSSTSPGLITLYQYDNASRLTKLTNYNSVNLTVTSNFEYTYDANSNRNLARQYLPLTNPVFSLNTTGYTYNASNQLMTAGNKTFTYDDNGNMLTISGSPSTNLTYNALNQLTQYTDGAANLTFGYDALGNRIRKTTGGVTTKYIVAPTSLPSVLAETDAGGNVTSYYIYGIGLVSKINATNNNTYYYQYDGLGSTVAITDINGTVVNKYVYDDFGNLATNSVEAIANPLKYVGKYGVQTDVNDLLYMRARYYKPSFGRFINKDPIGLSGGINPYRYVQNNPINLNDPFGLKTPQECCQDDYSVCVETCNSFEGEVARLCRTQCLAEYWRCLGETPDDDDGDIPTPVPGPATFPPGESVPPAPVLPRLSGK